MPAMSTTVSARHRAVLAASAALALVVLGIAAPKAAAAAAAVSRLGVVARSVPVIDPATVAELSDPGVELTVPADGRLRGDGVAVVVTGAALTGRAGTGGEEVSAGPGRHLIVFAFRLVPQPPDPGGPQASLALVAAGQRDPIDLTDLSGDGPWTFTASIPAGAGDADLELSAAGYTQDFNLLTLTRVAPTPAVLYRDPDNPQVVATDTETVRVAVTAGPPASTTYPLPVGAATTTLGWFAPDPAMDTPTSTGQAFLSVQLQTATLTDPANNDVQELLLPAPVPADHVQLVLPDGTAAPATHIDEDDTDVPGVSDNLFTGTYYFTVPADLTAATLAVAAYQAQGQAGELLPADATIHIAAFTIPITLSAPPPAPLTPPVTTLTLTRSAPLPAASFGSIGPGSGHGSGPAPLWLVLVLLAGATAVTAVTVRRYRARRPAPAGHAPTPGPTTGPPFPVPVPGNGRAPTDGDAPQPPNDRAPTDVDAPPPPNDRAPTDVDAPPPPIGPATRPQPATPTSAPLTGTRTPVAATPVTADVVHLGPARPAPTQVDLTAAPSDPPSTNGRLVSAPPPAAAPSAAANRADTGVDAPPGDGGDSDAVIRIDVLGPLQLAGPGTNKLRPRDIEVLVFLALNCEHPVTNDDIRAAVAGAVDDESNANTVRTWLSRLRGAVGAAVLPEAENGRYRVSGVATDIARFDDIIARAAASTDASETTRLLTEALTQVRGRPFDSLDYRWTPLLATSLETRIAEAAHRLATLSWDNGDAETAGWAARQGLSALGQPDDRLLEHVLRSSVEKGPASLGQAWREVSARYAAVGDAPGPTLVGLYDQLRTANRRI